MATTPAAETPLSDDDVETLLRLGFVPSYYLCQHPAWPDPLHVWPSSAENAQKTYDDHPHPDAYVLKVWERGPRQIVHAARGQEATDD